MNNQHQNQKQRPKVVVIAGPTASGKTALAVRVAEMFNGEVVGADSMQIYREMNIGTAKPTIDEMRGIPHHMIDILSPGEEYSVASYQKEATAVIEDILARGRLPVVCGGTGQYLHALLHNLQFVDNLIDEALESTLKARLETEGSKPLYQELVRLDATAAEKIHPNNTVRLVRALAMAISGVGITAQNQVSRAEVQYDFRVCALQYADRSLLYHRIDTRVDTMMENGLVAEAEALRNRYAKTSCAAIGYKELEEYFEGTITLMQAAERIKQTSRNYAKRQLTWLRPMPEANWIYLDRMTMCKEMEKTVAKLCGLV